MISTVIRLHLETNSGNKLTVYWYINYITLTRHSAVFTACLQKRWAIKPQSVAAESPQLADPAPPEITQSHAARTERVPRTAGCISQARQYRPRNIRHTTLGWTAPARDQALISQTAAVVPAAAAAAATTDNRQISAGSTDTLRPFHPVLPETHSVS